MDRNEAIKRIKAGLKARSGKTWSVTGGRGTAWGWITIAVPPARRVWDREGTAPKPEFGYSSAADRAELKALMGLDDFGQGFNVPASSAYYHEFVDRAEGREPSVRGERYWD